ncbi:MAG: T9SS type A sorting domain-containing protein [Flavobacteriales bacterium]|nr:T9SS type A sorting domain-containing protein [Flavobacteriales bacterium]
MKRFLLLPALLAMVQLRAQQIEEYRYWINDDPGATTVNGIGPSLQVNLMSNLVLPTLTKDYNTITIQFKDTNDVYSVPVSRIFTRSTGEVTGYEYWIDDDIANRVSGTVTAGTVVNLTSNLTLCLAAGAHVFAIRFQGASGTWSVPLTRQFTSTASPDTDGDGLCDALDPCPLLANLVPGNACNDGNPDTENDMVNASCLCVGTLANEDCEGVPGGPAQPGTPCDDNDECTASDVYDANCNCAGTFADADNDGVCDADDLCPGGPEPGMACNDNNPTTENDMVGADCVCAGTPTGIICTTDLDFVYQADGTDDLTWQIFEQGNSNLVQSGGGALIGNGSEATCLPDGCFYLVVTDGGGDGIVNGGYLLKINSSVRLIDNLYGTFGEGGFTSGGTSQIAANEGFCLPVGTDRLIFTSCDRRDWKISPCGGEFVVANANQDVSDEYGVNNANSGYQMWWYAPNGGYSFKRFQSHNTSNGLPASATRAAHFQLNAWTGNQLVEGGFYNVKVRGRVNGTYNNWGPACRLVVNSTEAQCPRTKLMDLPGNQYLSCGQSRTIGTNVYVHAKPVRRMNNNCNWVNANRYQFRFRIPAEFITIVKTSATGQYWVNTNGLTCGKTYEVDVRASFDNGSTWCHSSDPYGDICLLTTTCSFGMAEEGGSTATSEARVAMYPNPNNGDQLFLSLSSVEEGVESINVDIYDSFGKRVAQRTIGVQDGYVNTAIALNGELANGMYLVNIAAGINTYTERLMIQQ